MTTFVSHCFHYAWVKGTHYISILIMFCVSSPVMIRLRNWSLWKLIAVVSMVLFCGIWLMLPYATFAWSSLNGWEVFVTCRIMYIVICFHYSAIRCRLWTSSAVVVQHLLRKFLIAITMQLAMLHDMVSISVGCCRRLVTMLSSVAWDTVFSYKRCIY